MPRRPIRVVEAQFALPDGTHIRIKAGNRKEAHEMLDDALKARETDAKRGAKKGKDAR